MTFVTVQLKIGNFNCFIPPDKGVSRLESPKSLESKDLDQSLIIKRPRGLTKNNEIAFLNLKFQNFVNKTFAIVERNL